MGQRGQGALYLVEAAVGRRELPLLVTNRRLAAELFTSALSQKTTSESLLPESCHRRTVCLFTRLQEPALAREQCGLAALIAADMAVCSAVWQKVAAGLSRTGRVSR